MLNLKKSLNLLIYIGPGILVAATGIGAGDLATGAFAGSKLGLAVLWAVILGAFLKFVIIEGLTRWQLVTGQTLLEGAVDHLGRIVQYFFLAYLLFWTFCVGSALISACGVAAHALIPVFSDPDQARIIFGILHSLIGLTIVLIGSFSAFEKVMRAGIGMMFVTILCTAILVQPDWMAVLKGIVIPTIPEYFDANGKNHGVLWTLGLMGGVGGTLTLLSYGYWIREKNRTGVQDLKLCRIDLMVAYSITAFFGLSMVIIASRSTLEQQPTSALLVVSLADKLRSTLGPIPSLMFMFGAWSAVFCSMLGVWQSVPYLFADFWGLFRRQGNKVDTKGSAYRIYLFTIALVSMIGLRYRFDVIQELYAVFGSLVIPMLALVLLILNGQAKLVGKQYKNRPITVIVLLGALIFFGYLGVPEFYSAIVSLF